MTKFTYHPPVTRFPDFHLVEATVNGKQHTVAMVPVIELPKETVIANANLFAKAPELLWRAKELLCTATPNPKLTDKEEEWFINFGQWYNEVMKHL